MNYKLILAFLLLSIQISANTIQTYQIEKSAVVFQTQDGELRIEPLTERSIRVRFSKNLHTNIPEFVISNPVLPPVFTVKENAGFIEVRTHFVVAKIAIHTGQIDFEDASGQTLLSEIQDGRTLTADTINNEPAYCVEQRFYSPDDEVLMGLGQFQDGHLNLRGISRELIQVNTQIALPFLYSSKGYGILWHQYGKTDYNPANNPLTLEKVKQGEIQNQLADVTTTAGTIKVSQDQSRYQGTIRIPEEGEYSFFLNLGEMGNRHFLSVDGVPIVDQSNMWLPPAVGVKVKLTKGEHRIDLLCKNTNSPVLTWKKVDQTTTFRSPAAKELDYVFLAGSAENVLGDFRKLTGEVPLLPAWAYGFWQCRERYSSSDQLIKTAETFRAKQIPMDALVQDWQYWGNNGWGVPEFDPVHYPNPEVFIQRLHDLDTRFIVSIWSNPDKNSAMGRDFVSRKLYISDSKWLDYFNPDTRSAYWNTLRKNMFDKGVDAWWMDAVEPENDALKGVDTYWGKGDFLRLTYPYFVSKSVYEGQRATSDQKRVCILTRSAYPGQQKFGVINWSGDIGGTWDSFKRQIVAGLNYSMCGFPYWTTDIGGFFRPGRQQYSDDAYQELLIRWFQWGALNPIFRVHGYQSETELWNYKAETNQAIQSSIQFRYKLLPYIYSQAWQVTHNGSTLMRPLIMDFAKDSKAVLQPYEYMFGTDLLVCPVTQPGVKSQEMYLPGGVYWYDFHTGKGTEGGRFVQAETPLNTMPLFVKAGSILPLAKVRTSVSVQYDSLEVRIYEGADGQFLLYQDSGDSYKYEKGQYSTIQLSWNDAYKLFTMEKRSGAYEGMLSKMVLHISLIKKNSSPSLSTRTLLYKGGKLQLKLN